MSMSHEHMRVGERNTLGFWTYLMSDCILFASLFATYAVLMGETFGGATAETLTNLPFVFAETVLLLTSSLTIGLSLIAAQARKKGLAISLMLVTLLLGVTFLGFEVTEFSHLIAEGNGPGRSAFLSAFFGLVGTHGLHVLVGCVWLGALIVYAWKKGMSPSVRQKLSMLALFWHFLDVIWIFIFTVVYLFGALGI